MAKIKLKIITPQKILVEKEVDEVYSKAKDGAFGVKPDHIPFMTPLDIGVTKFIVDGQEDFVATIGGIFQIKENEALILSDCAELSKEIDVARAKHAKERAEARLGTGVQDVDANRAQAALSRALARLNAATKNI